MSANAIWTPDGVKNIGRTSERVELRPNVMEWLRQFSDVAAKLKIGLHCGLCGADLVGKNADSDRVYSVSCGCRDFLGGNRDHRVQSVQ